MKIQVYKDGVKHAYKLIQRAPDSESDNILRGKGEVNYLSTKEVVPYQNLNPIVMSRVSSHKGRSDQKQ